MVKLLMKWIALFVGVSLTGAGVWFWYRTPASPAAVELQGPLPRQTTLSPTPRATFTPNTRKGYYNIDVVGDFTVPATKKIIFDGAGRNLHVEQDRTKLFRRGFSAVDRGRMVTDVEVWHDDSPPPGWKSQLQISQRSLILYQNYFRDGFSLTWAADNSKATDVIYKPVSANQDGQKNLYQACVTLRGGCVGFGDCQPSGWKSTYGTIVLDIENNYGIRDNQEQANLYTYMAKTIKENASPQTDLGSIDPTPHNSYGFAKALDYTAGADLYWTTTAQHTATSRQRGMPDDIIGKSYADYADFYMPGTYYLYPELDYSARHVLDRDRHWLAALLGEQEVNMKLSTKKRIAWQWLFNTQNSQFPKSTKAEHPAPPAVAEGMAIFYWFTGAYGVLLWDDHNILVPDQPVPADSTGQGTGNDRHYACYEHYIHGLWRLFSHHKELFNGKETYLNEATDCSYDGGKTWYSYTANQIKTRDLPFVRAIVNGNQILVAATKAYAQPKDKNQVMLRYVQNGYHFYTTINLNGDEIYLGRATMSQARQ